MRKWNGKEGRSVGHPNYEHQALLAGFGPGMACMQGPHPRLTCQTRLTACMEQGHQVALILVWRLGIMG